MVEKPAPNIHKGDLTDARAANLRANLAKRKLARQPAAAPNTQKEEQK